MNNHKSVTCIIDSNNGGIVAICETPEDANKLLDKYVADNYDTYPETTENVWLETVPMNGYIF